MEISNVDIAKASLCSEGAVRKAILRGELNTLEELVGWCLRMRIKSIGLSGVDVAGEKPKAVFPKMIDCGNVKSVIDDLGYEPDNSQIEGEW